VTNPARVRLAAARKRVLRAGGGDPQREAWTASMQAVRLSPEILRRRCRRTRDVWKATPKRRSGLAPRTTGVHEQGMQANGFPRNVRGLAFPRAISGVVPPVTKTRLRRGHEWAPAGNEPNHSAEVGPPEAQAEVAPTTARSQIASSHL